MTIDGVISSCESQLPRKSALRKKLEDTGPDEAFIERYDTLLPLESQLNFPLNSCGFILNAGEPTGDGKRLKIGSTAVNLTETQAVFMALLMEDGFLTNDELQMAVPNSTSHSVTNHINRVNERVKAEGINGNVISPKYRFGHYLGDDYGTFRIQPKNFVGYGGFKDQYSYWLDKFTK